MCRHFYVKTTLLFLNLYHIVVISKRLLLLQILKDFPEEMKGELGLHLHKEILNLSIFEEATQGCLRSIALHTKRSFCAPGEFLVHKGDAANYLYLLVSGSMEILKMDMVVAILGKIAKILS